MRQTTIAILSGAFALGVAAGAAISTVSHAQAPAAEAERAVRFIW